MAQKVPRKTPVKSKKSSQKSTPKKSGCVVFATKILGDKWTPRLLFALSSEKLRFCQLQDSVGGINPRTLSKRLSDLETSGILTKVIFSEIPPHTEYSLTKKGKDLLPILKSMAAWGEKYAK